MNRYAIMRYWSIAAGCRVLRISLADEHGREHFAQVPAARLRGKDYRAKLEAILDAVQDAIDVGAAPGEVSL